MDDEPIELRAPEPGICGVNCGCCPFDDGTAPQDHARDCIRVDKGSGDCDCGASDRAEQAANEERDRGEREHFMRLHGDCLNDPPVETGSSPFPVIHPLSDEESARLNAEESRIARHARTIRDALMPVAGLLENVAQDASTGQYELDEQLVTAAVSGLERTRETLDAMVSKTAAEDAEDEDRLIQRLSELLRGVASGLKGPPPPLTLWSFHDLPERAHALREAARCALDLLGPMRSPEREPGMPFRVGDTIDPTVDALRAGLDGAPELAPLDVVQISPDAAVQPALCGLLAVVSEVRPWGIIAHVQAPDGTYPVRIATGGFRRIGSCAWVHTGGGCNG